MRRTGLFWFTVPIAAIILSAGLVLVPAVRDYQTLRHKAEGAAFVTMGPFRIPTDHLFRTSVEMSAFRQQGTITLLNAPGYVIYLLICLFVGHSSHWSPTTLGPSIWRDLSFPLCALPAWFFLGRALDACFASTRLRRADLVIGITLFTIFLILSAGLRFGLSPEERAGQDQLFFGYIYGFALWAGLMTIPLVAWLRQKMGTSIRA